MRFVLIPALLLLGACTISPLVDGASDEFRDKAAGVADDRLATGIYLTCTATISSIMRRFTTKETLETYFAFCLPEGSAEIASEAALPE